MVVILEKEDKTLTTKTEGFRMDTQIHNKETVLKNKCCFCDIKTKTKKYFSDADFLVIDCEKCKTPVLILKKHTDLINIRECVKIGIELNRLFGSKHQGVDKRYKIDFSQKDNPEHYHIHLRK